MANARNLGGVARARGPIRWVARLVHGIRRNSRAGARRNIAAHYDLGNDFYALWLDESMTYSSALFADPAKPAEGLAAAQAAKMGAALDRLNLKDGDRLMEIGCGWGGFAAQALARTSISYDGLTLSEEQAAWARAHLPRERAAIHLTDYRDARGQYDAIASIEMVEAVGQEHWPDYLAAIHRLLKPGGRAVIQYISIEDAIFERYAASADFIQVLASNGAPTPSAGRKGKVTSSFLNVRTGPATTNAKVGELKQGALVTIFETSSNGWHRIGDKRWVIGTNVQEV